jgi:hypothetical protein
MSTLRIAANLQTLPQNVRSFLPSNRQQRNGNVVTTKAAYDGAPGMREIDPQSSGRAGQISSMSTASTSTRTTPVSYRVSLFGEYMDTARIIWSPQKWNISGYIASFRYCF